MIKKRFVMVTNTEEYTSVSQAVEKFSKTIAMEDSMIDIDLTLSLLDEDSINITQPLSQYGFEAVGEKVKEMYSKGKSNFALYSKKFINFFFGWLIKLFGGFEGVKPEMTKNYKKASKYLKSLNAMEEKVRSANKSITITNAGNIVAYDLTIIQLIKICIEKQTGKLAETENNTTSTNIDVKDVVNMANTINNVVGSLELTNKGVLESKLRGVQFNISKLYENAEKEFADAKSNATKGKNNLYSTASYLTEPDEAEMKAYDAFTYLESRLKMFIDISKANNWNFEKSVKGCETARRNLQNTIKNLDVATEDDSKVTKALNDILKVGNNLSKLQVNANKAMQNLSKALNLMMTDVVKLQNAVTTVSGNPAEDEDE